MEKNLLRTLNKLPGKEERKGAEIVKAALEDINITNEITKYEKEINEYNINENNKIIEQKINKLCDEKNIYDNNLSKLNEINDKIIYGEQNIELLKFEVVNTHDLICSMNINKKKYDEYVKYKKLENDNEKNKNNLLCITNENNELKNSFNNYNEIIQNYHKNKKLQNDLNELNFLKKKYENNYNTITNNNGRIETININIDLCNERVKILNNDYNVAMENKIIVDKYEEILNEINLLDEQININNDEIKKHTDENKELINNINTLNVKLELLHNYKTTLEENTCDNEIYEKIIKLMEKNGIIDNVIKNNIIPVIEKCVNNLLTNVGHCEINIEMNNDHITIKKNNKIDLLACSGYEIKLFNLIFRIAIGFVNNNIKTNFMILDETFDSSDNKNKQRMIDLIKFIRDNTHFKFILVITHDNDIQNHSDMNIYIDKIDDDTKKIRIV
jgi:hypothetical protein